MRGLAIRGIALNTGFTTNLTSALSYRSYYYYCDSMQ